MSALKAAKWWAWLVLVALVGCANTTDPILKDHHCIASHTTVQVIAMPMTTCSKTCTTTIMTQPVVITHCDKAVWIEYPNPDYHPAPSP